MDLRPSDEQRQLVEAFAALYAKEATVDRVRTAEPGGFDEALWEILLQQGVVDMAVSEASGGWGASVLDLALIAEQQGWAIAPAPVIEAQVAARLLERVGHPREDRLVTFSPHGQSLVPAGSVADATIVLLHDRLVLVDLDDTKRVAIDNLGSLPLADLATTDGAPLAAGPDAVTAFQAAIDDYQVLLAAAVVGIGARALEIVVDYVKHRQAWGQPIGSFQGVAHRLADAATAIDGARLLVYEAAWAHGEDPARWPELSAMAFAFCSEAARTATYWAVHFHGGYGLMMESDLQLYFRRARAWPRVLASPDRAYDRVADRRYG